MAGFAIDIGDEGTAYSQGVTMPSATSASVAAEGISAIGKGVFGVLDKMDAAKRAAQPTESAVSREAFGRLSKSLDGLKGLDPLKQRADLAGIVTEYNNAGFDIGEAEARLIKQRTGIDVDYLNFDPQQEAINATVQKLQDNPAYLYNARNTLVSSGIENPTDFQIMQQAQSDVQANETAALYLVNAKNITRKQYFETYLPQAKVALENVRALALAGLTIETGGGDIKPENIVQLRTQFDIAKAQFTKPPLINTEDWQSVQSQIDTLDQLLTTLETYDEKVLAATKADILEPITKALMLQAKELGQTDPVLAASLLSDKVDWSAYVSSRYPEILKTLDSISAEDTVYTDLFAAPQDDTIIIEGETPPEPTADTLHDAEEISWSENLSPQARMDAIMFAATQRIGLMNPVMMDQPEHRNNFLAGIGKATVSISKSPRTFETKTMNLVYNDDTYSKLALIRNLDPEKAEIASKRLIDALQAQFNIASTTMSGTLQSSYFKITGLGKIEYDLDARIDTGQIRMDRAVLPLVKTSASKYYNGNVTAMLADRGRRVPTFERSQIENAGFKFNTAYQDYRKVQKNARSLDFYISNMKKLGVDTATIESLMVQPTVIGEPTGDLGTRTNPFQIFWSDETDTDEKLFASIDDGQYFIGPDGKTYVKGMD